MLSYHLEFILYSFKVFGLRYRIFFKLIIYHSFAYRRKENIRELSNCGILMFLPIQRPVLLHPFSFIVLVCVYISLFL